MSQEGSGPSPMGGGEGRIGGGGGGGGSWQRAPPVGDAGPSRTVPPPPASSRTTAAAAAAADPGVSSTDEYYFYNNNNPGDYSINIDAAAAAAAAGPVTSGGGGGGSGGALRLRKGSTDSTRGAFYSGANAPKHPVVVPKKAPHRILVSSGNHDQQMIQQQQQQQQHHHHQQQQQQHHHHHRNRGRPKKSSSSAAHGGAVSGGGGGAVHKKKSWSDLAVSSSDDTTTTDGQHGFAAAAAAAGLPSTAAPRRMASFQNQQQQQQPYYYPQPLPDDSSLYFSSQDNNNNNYGSIPENNQQSNKNNKNNNDNNRFSNISALSDRFSMESSVDSLRFSLDDLAKNRTGDAANDAATAVAQLQNSATVNATNNARTSPRQEQSIKDIASFASMVQRAAAAAAAAGSNYNTDEESLAAAASASSPEQHYSSGKRIQYTPTMAASAAHGQQQQQQHEILSNTSNFSEDEEEEEEEMNTSGSDEEYEFEYNYNQHDVAVDTTIGGRIMQLVDPTDWLMHDVQWNNHGDGGNNPTPYFDASKEWTTLAGQVRHFLYNPISPEFTSLQQINWAVIVGIVMGIYTAIWKTIIEGGVDFVWKTIPEFLFQHGVFTDLNGSFPLYHYMWICPMIFSAILSYIFVILPNKIPGQNEWINSLHTRGVQDYRTFWPLFILSTLGMVSGLSLGPELPLILTAGMFGSWLGLLCKQSMLQARVMNLTAAGAAIGGFFGFPMAGALFVLEVPHRMGLQYFEALSPATIASIVAVISNRLVTGNDVTGYYKYPFLTESLPSSIFTHAMFYGVYGAGVGIAYAWGVLEFKHIVTGMFVQAPHHHHHHHHHVEHDDDKHEEDNDGKIENEEMSPLNRHSKVGNGKKQSKRARRNSRRNTSMAEKMKNICTCLRSYFSLVIPDPAYRAAVRGAIVGCICGVVGILLPHTLFWGEAQLQNLIDKGRTPLPVFGQGNEPTADFLALGYCVVDPSDKDAIRAGFSVGCALAIAVTKTIVIGLSLGTGIIGGHFWGPLFVGCAASHLLSDVVKILNEWFGLGPALATYPCVVMLCTMGAAHVVTYRAHMGIMLILTLTISAFSPEDGNPDYSIAGDYSAVFPLLVISVFEALMLSRSTVFYAEQRPRGDITAVPEVLCEPGMEGRPLVDAYEASDESHSSSSGSSSGPDDSEQDLEVAPADFDDYNHMAATDALLVKENEQGRTIVPPPPPAAVTQESIEDAFLQATMANSSSRVNRYNKPPSPIATTKTFTGMSPQPSPTTLSSISPTGPLPPTTGGTRRHQRQHGRASTLGGNNPLSSERLDELLSMPLVSEPIETSGQFDQSSQRSSTTTRIATQPPMVGPLPTNRAYAHHRRTMSAPSHPDNLARAQTSGSCARKMVEMEQATATPAIVAPVTRGRTAIFDQPPVRERSNSNSSRHNLIRVNSFGELGKEQPSLMEQARFRAASNADTSRHQRKPSLPSLPSRRHSRKNSAAKVDMTAIDDGALSFDEIERTFNNVAHVAFSNVPSQFSGSGGSNSRNKNGSSSSSSTS